MRAVRTIALMILIPLGGMAQLPQRDPRASLPVGDSAIAGRVKTSEGRPLARARIMLRLSGLQPSTMSMTVNNGVVTTSGNIWQAVTDNTGQFSFNNLPPGTYLLSGTHAQYLPIQYGQRYVGQAGRPIELGAGQRMRADLVAVKGTAITGRVFDENSDPMQDVSVIAYRYVVQGKRKTITPVGGRSYASNDIGQYRIANLPPGEYLVAATYRGMTGGGSETAVKEGYAPTWYPGTIAPAAAQVVRVMPGNDVMSIDFVLQPTRMVQATGTIVTAGGAPAGNSTLWVSPVDGDVALTTRLSTRVMTDGTFIVPEITPGDYIFTAQYSPRVAEGRGGPVPPMAPGRGAPQVLGAREFGSLRVSVGTQPVENLMLQLRPAARVSVRLQSDIPLPGRRSVQFLTEEPTSVSTSAPLSDTNEAIAMIGPGRYRPSVSLPEGWAIDKITAEGRDVTATGIVVGSESSISVVIHAVSRGAVMMGTAAAGAAGAPADYTLVVMAENADERTAAGGGVKSARPDQTGRFTLKGLRAGSYYVGALNYVDPNELYDPAFWARVEPNAIRVTVAAGETKQISAPFISRR